MSLKVLKFGGTSVGTVESISLLKGIVEHEAQTDDIIVVVSALGGLTDRLIATADMAKGRDEAYLAEVTAMQKRHHDMIDAIVASHRQESLKQYIDAQFADLSDLYSTIYNEQRASLETMAAVVSFGELLSSNLTANIIEGAVWKDSREFIKTETRHSRFTICEDLTAQLLHDAFLSVPHITVCPGFISSDCHDGHVTNLGRGGSDFTAAILAAELGAEALEIWTDVDGFMTADPRIIAEAHTIVDMSYSDAMELCNYGAKVIYPPTLYPVCQKKIPIYVKNTFHASHCGTCIVNKIAALPSSRLSFCGLSSMKDISVLSIKGPEMQGVYGLHRRIASCLLEKGVEILFMDSSDDSISLIVRDAACADAVGYLHDEFQNAVRNGRLHPIGARSGLATVTLVGSIADSYDILRERISAVLARAEVSPVLYHLGSEHNSITLVVEKPQVQTVLNVLHREFL